MKLLLPALLMWIAAGTFVDIAVAESTHPVSVVEADIYVGRSKLTMRLKCFAEDLELLQGVEPYEETGKYDNQELKDGTQDHAKYLAEKIVIMDAAGVPIEGKVTEVIGFEIPAEGISAGQLMNYSMGYVIEYTYDEPPEFITVSQQMVAEGALLPSELKILMKQAGSDTPYVHMMKPGLPETFQFDWEKAPLKSDASQEDWDNWFEEQREKNLGIESYSSVYSFIYITRREVRQEILIPIASLGTFMEIEGADDGFLSIEEQDALKPKIEAMFSTGNPVRLGRKPVKPTFDRIDFYGLDLRDFAMQSSRRKVSMASGRVGVIMSYPCEGSPEDVSISWDLFNDIVRSVDVIVFALDDVRRTQFSKFLENNTFEWSSENLAPLEPVDPVPAHFDLPAWSSFPWLSVVLWAAALVALVTGWLRKTQGQYYVIAGGITMVGVLLIPFVNFDLYAPGARTPEVETARADEIFQVLHRNLFRSFEFTKEGDVYDALSQSVDGKLLDDLYLQLNDSLKMQEQGGAVSVIEQVDLIEGNRRENRNYFSSVEPGFVYRCKWDLVGTIEHWGHIHQRTNHYDATFDVQAIDDEWKITAMKLEDSPQGVVRTRVRKF